MLGRGGRFHVDLPQGAKNAPGAPRLTQIKRRAAASPRIQSIEEMRVNAIFNSSELSDELQALKSEVSRLLNAKGDGPFDAAKNRADALANQIKAALTELGETLSEEEDHIAKLIDQPFCPFRPRRPWIHSRLRWHRDAIGALWPARLLRQSPA